MFELNGIYAGPAVNKTKTSNPTEVMVRLIQKHPDASYETIEKKVIAKIEDDEDLRTPALQYFCRNAWSSLHRTTPYRRNNAETARQIAEGVQRAKQIVLLELIAPNGKRVGDCTGIEMTKFGGFYAKIGKAVGRRKVGAVLSEDQLWKLWKESK